MPYTTWQLDTAIAQLEAALLAGATAAEVSFEGRMYRAQTAAEIRNRISYFNALYPTATDAPPQVPKTRTFYLFGGKGIGW
jgi:hypothetical protein